jgi:aspartate 1-decarboxylase
MNGAAARLTQVGDRVIIISYAEMTPEEAKSYRPRTVVVDENNNPKSILDYSQPETTFDLITGLETK